MQNVYFPLTILMESYFISKQYKHDIYLRFVTILILSLKAKELKFCIGCFIFLDGNRLYSIVLISIYFIVFWCDFQNDPKYFKDVN